MAALLCYQRRGFGIAAIDSSGRLVLAVKSLVSTLPLLMNNVKAFVFDVFGTVVDWRTSVVAELQAQGAKHGIKPEDADWNKFAAHWRSEYMKNTRRIAGGGQGPLNVDIMHREILDEMLQYPQWERVGAAWDNATRHELTLAWHRLKGWPDAVQGLQALKKSHIVTSLSNGNMSLLIDMAKYADLPWDTIFSTELFDTFKPSPKAYRSTIKLLGLEPSECAMVAAHIFDLRGAASVGMKTIYVPRPQEDADVMAEGLEIKSKKDGGEVDLVVGSFTELAEVVNGLRA